MYCYRHPDRETGLSCSECGRPICTDCMTVAPVGLRCPDHATNRPQPVQAARTQARAVTASLKNAFYDVITRHFNGQIDDKKAVAELVSAAKN